MLKRIYFQANYSQASTPVTPPNFIIPVVIYIQYQSSYVSSPTNFLEDYFYLDKDFLFIILKVSQSTIRNVQK